MNEIKSNDILVDKLSKVLITISEQKGFEFALGTRKMAPEFALSYNTLLLMFILDAKMNYEKVFNRNYSAEELIDEIRIKNGDKNLKKTEIAQIQTLKERDEEYINNRELEYIFPVKFYETEPEETLFDYEPRIEHVVSESTCPFSVLAMFVTHAFEEYTEVYEKNPSLLVDGAIPLDPIYFKWAEIIKNRPTYLRVYSLEEAKELDAKKQM